MKALIATLYFGLAPFAVATPPATSPATASPQQPETVSLGRIGAGLVFLSLATKSIRKCQQPDK
jgi:hypothetical protein